MGFLEKSRSSFYSPEFYREVLGQPLTAAFRYYFSLIAILSLFVSAVGVFYFVPVVREFTDTTLGQITASIPEDLVLRIRNNEASTNATSSEPIYFRFPGDENGMQKETTFLVLDTTRRFSFEQFHAYDTLLWVSQDGVAGAESGYEVQFGPFDGIEDLTITRAFIAEKINYLRGYLPVLYAIMVPIMFLGIFVFHLFTLLYLLLGALFVVLIAKIKGVPLTYGSAYAIALYAVTASLVFRLFAVLVLPFSTPFAFTLIFLLVVWINLKPAIPGEQKIGE